MPASSRSPPAPDVDIRVHVAAPATAAHDALYRRLALAYLAFRPSPSPFQPRPFGCAADEVEPSFESVLDNRASPPPPRPPRSPSSSWQTPPSEIADSYPLPDSALLNATPTRLLHHGLGHGRRPASAEASMETTEAEVETSLEMADDEVEVEATVDFTISEFGAAADLTHVEVETSLERIPLTPKPALAPTRHHLDRSSVHLSHLSSSDPLLEPASSPPEADPDSDAESSLSSSPPSPLELRPPSPPVSLDILKPPDLVPEELADLARRLSSRYHPLPRRPTSPLERGYWLLDCATWTRQTRSSAWRFLANYLASGRAGWGVWCRRDPSRRWLRLYCWACVAQHTYLLLYLASARQIKATGAAWVGADGEVALQVAARPLGHPP